MWIIHSLKWYAGISVGTHHHTYQNLYPVTINIYNPITRCCIFFVIYGSWPCDRDIRQLITWRTTFCINVNFKVSTEIRWEKLSNRINRIIGSVPLNGKSLSDSAPEVIRFTCGSPNNSSALPDKLFHPWHQPLHRLPLDVKPQALDTNSILDIYYIAYIQI